MDNKIIKVKVYVKNPSEAPAGVKLQEGKRGGHFYESKKEPKMSYEDLENLHDDTPQEDGFTEKTPKKLKIISRDSTEYLKLIDTIGEILQVSSYDIEQPTPEYMSNLIRTNNINIPDGISVYVLPCNMLDAFAFVVPNIPDIVYLVATPDDEINKWLETLKFDLMRSGYDEEELKDITVDTKRAASIVHEIGHLKVHKAIHAENLEYTKQLQSREMEYFKPYVEFVIRTYNISAMVVINYLDEMLAEDYRQIIGGNQTALPNRYFYPWDTVNSDNYKYKQERLDILKKIGVF